MAVAFYNPIEDVPPIATTVELSLLTADKGGLSRPLELPSPSLVFRDLEADGIVGYTAMIGADAKPLRYTQMLWMGLRTKAAYLPG